VWDWGDDTTTPAAVDGRTVTGHHVYLTAGVYAVTLTVSDDAGGSDVAATELVVVFDPAGKTFHGNGKHDLGSGELQFGWQFKPKGGEPSISGNARFELTPHDAELPGQTFEADELTALYFLNSWAMATGTGAWEGGDITTDAEFLVTGFDGNTGGSDDMLRIKVWVAGDPTTVLFDTQTGDVDLAFPTLVPDKGNIKIKTA
jgi:PKD repeat protein